MAKFEAEISANVNGFISDLNKAEKKAVEFATVTDKEMVSAAGSFKPLFDQARKLNETIASLKPVKIDVSNISLGATSGIIAGIQDRISSLKGKIEGALNVSTIEKYNIELREAQSELKKLNSLGVSAAVPKSINATAGSIQKFTNTTGQANNTAMEFTRIIQDAPYGMIGIGNNIQQLTANFGQLKNSAGSTGAALKQTFSSLLSSGNLLSLGVAAITSAWTFYTISKQKSNKANEESIDIMKQMIEGLNEQSKVLYDAANSTGKEVAQLNTLYSISQDVTASTTQRTNAANKLIKQYPDLLGNFTAEEVLLGKSNEAYKRLSSSILETARAQAAYGKIGEKAAQQIAIDEANKALRTQSELLDKQLAKQRQINAASVNTNSYGTGNVINAQATYNIESQLSDLSKEMNKNLLERAKLQEGILDLEKIAVSNQLKSLDVTEAVKTATEGQAKATKDYGLELNSILAGFGDYDAKLALVVAKYKELNEVASNAGATVSQKLLIKQKQEIEELLLALGQVGQASGMNVGGMSGGISIPITLNTDMFDKSMDIVVSDLTAKSKEAGEAWSEGFNSIVNNAVIDSAFNLSDAIGNAIGSGGNVLNAAKNALLGTLGGIMSEVGKMTIKLGVAMLGIQNLLKNPFTSPYVAIAAGVALVAVGAAFSAGSKSIASGGSGSSGYNQSAASGTVIRNDMGTGRLYNNDKQVVELKLKNTELVGAMNLNSNRNNRLS